MARLQRLLRRRSSRVVLRDSSHEPDPLQYFWDGALVVLADQVSTHGVHAHRLDDLLVARKSVGDISSREEGGRRGR